MARSSRFAPGGMVFHVLNRRSERKTLFYEDADYIAFEQILMDAIALKEIRMPAYCLMPNHWHLVLWPSLDGELSEFMHRITSTHAVKWKMHHGTRGEGHLYQGRFKSFPVQSDEHYLTVVRYVERNALRANLVTRAEEWKFSSLHQRLSPRAQDDPLLSRGPIDLPDDWVEQVNHPQTSAELEALRASVRRGRPYGTSRWRRQSARELNLESTLRPIGRPKKSTS